MIFKTCCLLVSIFSFSMVWVCSKVQSYNEVKEFLKESFYFVSSAWLYWVLGICNVVGFILAILNKTVLGAKSSALGNSLFVVFMPFYLVLLTESKVKICDECEGLYHVKVLNTCSHVLWFLCAISLHVSMSSINDWNDG